MEGLEGFGGFGGFGKLWNVWSVCGLANGSFETHSHCCGLGPGVPVGEVALALGCLLGRVFGGFGWRVLEGLESFENFGGFGAFAGWQTAALKAHRKPLLWPWPWGACSGSGLGPGVLAGEGVWRVWSVLEGLEGLEGFGRFGAFAGGQTAALKAHTKRLLWPWPWGACWGRCLEGLESFGWFGGFWRAQGFGGFGGFWSVERLRAGKRQL